MNDTPLTIKYFICTDLMQLKNVKYFNKHVKNVYINAISSRVTSLLERQIKYI